MGAAEGAIAVAKTFDVEFETWFAICGESWAVTGFISENGIPFFRVKEFPVLALREVSNFFQAGMKMILVVLPCNHYHHFWMMNCS